MHRHAPLVEPEEDRLRLDALDAEADEMRHSIDGIAVERHAADPHRRVTSDALGELALSVRFRGEPTVGGHLGGRRAEADHGRDVLEPAPPGTFLRASDDERREPQAAAHEQGAGALRPSELVRADRAQVGIEGGEVDRDVPAAMHASTCTRTPRSRHAAATAVAGWIVPTSWFASCTVTSAVAGRTASSTSVGL